MNPLLEQFLQEARENLKFIEQHLEELGNGDSELLNSIFRAAHTLKGGSGIVGFEAVKNITHKAEDLLDLLRSKKLEYKPSMLGALYDAFDEVLNLVEAAEENGDVVEADKIIETKIVKHLCEQMGIKEQSVTKWEFPVKISTNPNNLVNFKTLSLKEFDYKLPFEKITLTQENFYEKRVYLLLFDLDKDCMMFGNDPIYALSLLEDKVVCISSFFSKDNAKNILGGFNDEDEINLYLNIAVIVDATYEEIEEALYNFLDDIVFLPLDISSFLSVDIGKAENIDFIKDLVKKAKELALTKDTIALKETLEESLLLMNQDSKQAIMINRLLNCFDAIEDFDVPKLTQFFDALKDAKEFIYEQEKNIQKIETEKGEVKSIQQQEFNEGDIAVAKELLTQQKEQLLKSHDFELFERVKFNVTKCFKVLNKNFDENISDRVVLLNLIDEALGISEIKEKKEKEVALIAQEPKIIKEAIKVEPKIEVKKEKDIIGKVVKVEQESIDHLMSVVGELLVAKNSLPYLADSVFELELESIKRVILEKYSFIDRLTNQLQDIIMSMRMLPISYVFDRYPKLVREISKKLDKKVKLTQEGGETKLDKNMIEMLADPLIHIIRNSLDHGIEIPSVRREAGKDENGEILMRAYPQSDKVIIEIQDDGKGIDAQRVINKVLEKNLMEVEKIEQLSESEKLNLIFLPGLSTVEEISEYSGRGVGMDVVKKSIESFGGSVSLSSELGKGTKLTMAIPVSLAVTTLLHISMNSLHYGFPMDSVNETVKIEKDEITYLNNEPFVYIRGQVIPLIMIKEILNLEKLKNAPLSIVVLNVKENLIAIVVNELLGQLDVVQKPLEGMLKHHPLISGTALLGNGQIIMIFDPIGILEFSEEIKIDKLG